MPSTSFLMTSWHKLRILVFRHSWLCSRLCDQDYRVETPACRICVRLGFASWRSVDCLVGLQPTRETAYERRSTLWIVGPH